MKWLINIVDWFWHRHPNNAKKTELNYFVFLKKGRVYVLEGPLENVQKFVERNKEDVKFFVLEKALLETFEEFENIDGSELIVIVTEVNEEGHLLPGEYIETKDRITVSKFVEKERSRIKNGR